MNFLTYQLFRKSIDTSNHHPERAVSSLQQQCLTSRLPVASRLYPMLLDRYFQQSRANPQPSLYARRSNSKVSAPNDTTATRFYARPRNHCCVMAMRRLRAFASQSEIYPPCGTICSAQSYLHGACLELNRTLTQTYLMWSMLTQGFYRSSQ